MKVTKVSSRVRYAAFLSPVTRRYHVKREVLDRGQWVASPSVMWNAENEDSAERLCDKQAALERHLIKERASV